MKNNELAILDISGSWINNRGSILKLNQVDSSQIHGTYTTAVAKTIGCIGYPAPVSGFINGYGIALSISMRGCKSPVVITKTGSCILKDNLIEQINITSIVQYRGIDSFNSRLIGIEEFTPIKK